MHTKFLLENIKKRIFRRRRRRREKY